MDVKELIITKNITYKSQGRDYVVRCLNPEHEDTHPSMRIDKITGLFNCYSCGFGGDLFELFGEKKNKFIDRKVNLLKEKIMNLINQKSLTLPLDATLFKQDFRGINSKTFQTFGAFTSETMQDMQDRVIFPIYDICNRITAFHGRYIHSNLEPKYKTVPEHSSLPLYPSIIEPIKNSIVLVEGMFDMLNLYDKGLCNTVCTFGTNFGAVKSKHKQIKNLERLIQYKYQGVDTIYIMFDDDDSGNYAAKKLKSYINEKFMTHIIKLENGQDPGKLTQVEIDKIRRQW